MIRRIGLGMATLLAILALAPAAPALAPGIPPHPLPPVPVERPPAVSADTWILWDGAYQIELGAKEADLPRPMASTTKIMTALLAYEAGDLSRPVLVRQRAAEVGEAEIGLEPGEIVPLGDLVTVLLIRSANDAAMAVAEALGGTVEGFVDMMNERAAELGMDNTHFANPHGLDAPGHVSSARDLLILARAAMEHPEFAEAVASPRHEIPPAPDGSRRLAEATNRLLELYPGAIGIKTGYTFEAELVLVAAAERDGRRLYAVVMGSEGLPGAHFEDAIALLDYGFEVTARFPAAAGPLLGQGDRAPIVPEDDTEDDQQSASEDAAPEVAEPAAVRVIERQLPGLGEALRWFRHYVRWLVGDV